MDNDMSYVHGGGTPSQSGWSTSLSQTNDSSDDFSEQQLSLVLPPSVPAKNFVLKPCILGQGGGETDSSQFSLDINQMLDDPFRNIGHQRAHSEILTSPKNDINFDSDLSVLGSGHEAFFSNENEEPDLSGIYLDMDRLNFPSAMPPFFQVGEPSSAAVVLLPPPLPPLSTVAAPLAATTESPLGLASSSVGQRPRSRHHSNQSVDGLMTIDPKMIALGSKGPSVVERKKALTAAKLAELAVVDPRRANRILLNRQSAARSKERKLRHIVELERKVHTLQTHVTTLSSQWTLWQRDTTGLNTENHELKYRLQTMEERIQLQDALNDALKDEIKYLKVLPSQAMHNGAPTMKPFAPFAPRPPSYPPNNSDPSHLIALQQLQQLQIQPPELQYLFQVQHHQLP